jgi:uncharacterized protein YkwD
MRSSALVPICVCATVVAISPPKHRAQFTTDDVVTVTTTVVIGSNYSVDFTSPDSSGQGSWSVELCGDLDSSSATPYTPNPGAPSGGIRFSSSLVTSTQPSISPNYIQDILYSHNIHRTNATVPGLTWNNTLADIAVDIAVKCIYAHDTSTGGGGYGQNIGAGAPPEDIPAMITDQMYNGEINFYPGYGTEPDMGNFERWGHYSQIVWKSTTSVGCATLQCPRGLANTGAGVRPYFTVCNYSPAGESGILQLSF